MQKQRAVIQRRTSAAAAATVICLKSPCHSKENKLLGLEKQLSWKGRSQTNSLEVGTFTVTKTPRQNLIGNFIHLQRCVIPNLKRKRYNDVSFIDPGAGRNFQFKVYLKRFDTRVKLNSLHGGILMVYFYVLVRTKISSYPNIAVLDGYICDKTFTDVQDSVFQSFSSAVSLDTKSMNY